MFIPIKFGTKRKMFSSVWSSALRTGSLGVPLLSLALLSAAIAAACNEEVCCKDFNKDAAAQVELAFILEIEDVQSFADRPKELVDKTKSLIACLEMEGPAVGGDV